MGGDFSRLRFQSLKRYAAVLLQQGRVQLDSDWNEAEAIRDHRQRTLIRDLIGPAAFAGDGFALSADGDRLTVGAGHAWVDGLLCELATDTDAGAQPDLPSVPLPAEPGWYIGYLEVWQREVTASEDESLLEPALGGADTSVRLTTVAQVRFHRIPGTVRRRRPTWSLPNDAADARLAVRGGYKGTENRLYRIEIHDGGDQPTFKWSRDNASTTAPVESVTPTEIALARSDEPDFGPGDDLEVIDQGSILERRPGWFVGVDRIDGDRLAVSSDEPAPGGLVRPLVRRWDGRPIPIRPKADNWIDLGDGVEIQFGGSHVRSGDYWLIAARAADASLTWPDATDAAVPHPPHGIEVHCVPVASLRRDERGWTILEDFRQLLEPLTQPTTDAGSGSGTGPRTTNAAGM